jgi:hypothetical protein
MTRWMKLLTTSSVVAATAVLALGTSLARASTPTCGQGAPFYTYSGSTPLADITPGTVLASRTFTDWGFWWPVKVVQLLYRSTGVLGQPTANVTSVLLPTGTPKPGEAVSDQLAYDSLSCTNEPSFGLFNGSSAGDDPGPYLAAGIAVIIPDTEGQAADMTEGHEYGMNTLDSIRAATSSSLTGLSKSTKVARRSPATCARWRCRHAPWAPRSITWRRTTTTTSSPPRCGPTTCSRG